MYFCQRLLSHLSAGFTVTVILLELIVLLGHRVFCKFAIFVLFLSAVCLSVWV